MNLKKTAQLWNRIPTTASPKLSHRFARLPAKSSEEGVEDMLSDFSYEEWNANIWRQKTIVNFYGILLMVQDHFGMFAVLEIEWLRKNAAHSEINHSLDSNVIPILLVKTQ